MIYVYIIIIISSGEVYMIDNPKSQGLEFYKKVKEEIDLEESYCAQPSGEFSTWFGNRYDYKTKLWNWYKGSKIMNTSIELIKDPSSPEEICLTNEFGKFSGGLSTWSGKNFYLFMTQNLWILNIYYTAWSLNTSRGIKSNISQWRNI